MNGAFRNSLRYPKTGTGSFGFRCLSRFWDLLNPRPGIAFWWFAAALSIACVVPVWLCQYFPSQNGPSLLHIAYMEHEFDNPNYGFSEFYDFHFFPVPYRFQTTVLRVLFLFIDPLQAQKVCVTAVLLLRCGAVFYFLRRLQPGREVFGLACLPLLYDFSLMRGYFNYHVGISIGLIVFGFYAQARNDWTWRRTILFNALVLLQYFAHPIALATIGLLIAVYDLVLSRSPLKIPGIVLRGYVPSVMLLSGFFAWTSWYGAWTRPTLDYLSLADKIQNFYFRGATPLSPLVNTASLGLLFVVGCVTMIQLYRHYRYFGDDKSPRRFMSFTSEPMIAVFLMALLLYLIMPWNFTGWHKADIRLIPIVFLMLIAAPKPLQSRRACLAFSLTAGVIVVGSLIPITQTMQIWSDDVAEYVAGMDAVPRQSRILPIFGETMRSGTWKLDDAIDPVHRADSYYALQRGGATPYSLADNNTLYWVWYKNYRDGGPFPRIDRSHPSASQYREAAANFDAILLWDCEPDIRLAFEDRGFRTTFERGRLVVLVQPTEHVKMEHHGEITAR